MGEYMTTGANHPLDGCDVYVSPSGSVTIFDEHGNIVAIRNPSLETRVNQEKINLPKEKIGKKNDSYRNVDYY